MVTATRMCVRFLIAPGRCGPGVDEAIPPSAMGRLATLPQSLSADDVERILPACALSTPLGGRDQALLLREVPAASSSASVCTASACQGASAA